MDKNIKKIIDKISEEKGIPKWKVELVIMHQFKFLRDTIESGDFENFRIRYLGKFIPSKKRLAQREKKKNV